MKLNISLSKRLHQLFCKHENVNWMSVTKGINSKIGYEFVNFQCYDCKLSINEWFKEGEWQKLNPFEAKEYIIKN